MKGLEVGKEEEEEKEKKAARWGTEWADLQDYLGQDLEVGLEWFD